MKSPDTLDKNYCKSCKAFTVVKLGNDGGWCLKYQKETDSYQEACEEYEKMGK